MLFRSHRRTRGESFSITEIVIDDDSCLDSLGKGKGKYITLEGSSLSRFSDDYEQMTLELAGEIRNLIPDGEILVAGLGNNDITPDALGPQVTAKILATRHLRDELDSEEEQFLTSLRPVSAFAGGVLGQTGIETSEMVRAIVQQIHPAGIIVVDALACSEDRKSVV